MITIAGGQRVVRLLSALLFLAAFACGPAQTAQSPAAGSSEPAANGDSSADLTLAEKVAAQIRKLRPGTQIEVKGPLDLTVQTEQLLQVHLGNLEAECQESLASCNDRIRAFSQAVLGVPSGKLTEQTVLPVLKTQAWITSTEKLLAGDGHTKTLVAFPFVDDLRIVLVHDTPATTKHLTDADIEEVGWTKESALERARANLKRLAARFKFQEAAPELYGVALNNGYDAATMILHAEWGALRNHVAGDLVVAPGGRDILLFTGTKNERGLKALLMVLQVEKQEPRAAYPITTNPYRWDETGWKPFVP